MKQRRANEPTGSAGPADGGGAPQNAAAPGGMSRGVRWGFAGVSVAGLMIAMSVFVASQPTGAQGPEPRPVDRFVASTLEIRPSVVAVGSYLRTDQPTVKYFGTGFVVDDGLTVVTNAHVVEALRKQDRLGELRVFFPDTVRDVDGREAKVVIEDKVHDVALIQFTGKPGKPLKLAAALIEPEQGTTVGIVGYPTGTMLGLVPAVHKGVVAAVVPAVLPLPVGVKMTPEIQAVLKNPYQLYQLDMMAYPGNSGSPLYDAHDGSVIGILNMTLATKTREHLFDKPTGIAYAVPVKWIHDIIRRSKTEIGK